ncbi:MAG: hypothetical protein J6J61_04750, partial [Muribaculaceae bacterium]|nr:hypothetical protein [Muribaculaceae bacterium]
GQLFVAQELIKKNQTKVLRNLGNTPNEEEENCNYSLSPFGVLDELYADNGSQRQKLEIPARGF